MIAVCMTAAAALSFGDVNRKNLINTKVHQKFKFTSLCSINSISIIIGWSDTDLA